MARLGSRRLLLEILIMLALSMGSAGIRASGGPQSSALAATAKYTAAAGSVNNAMARMVATINRVNGVYERDLAVHLQRAASPGSRIRPVMFSTSITLRTRLGISSAATTLSMAGRQAAPAATTLRPTRMRWGAVQRSSRIRASAVRRISR